MKQMPDSSGTGIVIRDGRWVMLCGSTAVPIRFLDSEGKDKPAPMFAREHDQEEANYADIRQPGAN
jgi:hypothetical protein